MCWMCVSKNKIKQSKCATVFLNKILNRSTMGYKIKLVVYYFIQSVDSV